MSARVALATLLTWPALACAEDPPFNPHNDVCSVERPADIAQPLIVLSPQVELVLDDRVCHPGTNPGCAELINGSCLIEIGDVAVGDVVRRTVNIGNPSHIGLIVSAIGVAGCPDVYVEGPTPSDVPPDEQRPFTIAVRLSQTEPCRATVLVSTNAGNATGDTPVTVVATTVNGAIPVGCTAENACCCNGESVIDTPACVDERVSCAFGDLFFGERCTESGACAP